MTEAQCMFDWLTAHGIDESRIIMEDKATSTAENLEFSFDIIRSLGVEPDGNTAILSSPYHLFRAKSKRIRIMVANFPFNPSDSRKSFIW